MKFPKFKLKNMGPVGTVILGSTADMAVSYVGQQLYPASMAVGGYPIYTSDIIGVAFGAGMLYYGRKKHKSKYELAGAGGLGLSLANMLNRALKTWGPSASLPYTPLRLNNSPMRLNIRPVMNNVATPSFSGSGRYRAVTSPAPMRNGGGIGKYR